MKMMELEYLRKLLLRVYPRDAHVEKALSYVDKDLAQYAAKKGQLREQYEVKEYPW